MRPIRLVLRAFGPYANEQEIDFRELEKCTFFLIHGPTGSGKTSILDSIAFALYGDTSTRERQAQQMRSDHAPAHILTEVEFDFSLGHDYYRIKRSPLQLRPKKRGGGSTKQDPMATLWSRNGLSDDNEEGAVCATGYSEVTLKVEEILGFRSDQFRQVVVLPQGQFRDFLLAGSAKREEILEILFKTESFRFIQEALKEEANTIREKWELGSELRKNKLIDAGVESLKSLKELHKKRTDRITDLAKELDKAREEERGAQKKVRQGEMILEKIKEKEEAENQLKELKAGEETFKEKEIFLQKARKTLPLQEVRNELVKRNKENEEACKRYRELETLLKTAEEEEVIAKQRTRETEIDRPRLEEIVKEIARLEEFQKKVLTLKTTRDELSAVGEEVKKKEDEHNRIKELITECEIEREQKDKIYKEKHELGMSHDGLKKSYESALEQYNKRVELDHFTVEYADAKKIMEKVQKEYKQEDLVVKKQKKEYEALQETWQNVQAAILAASLEEKKPCPVCGSEIHPSPAVSDEVLPTEKEIRAKKKELDTHEETRHVLYDELNMKLQGMTELQSKIDILAKQLKNKASEHPDLLKETVEKKKLAMEQATGAALLAMSLEKEIRLIKEKEKELKIALEKNEESIKKAIENRGKATNRVHDLEKAIPGELQSESVLSSTLGALGKEQGSLRMRLKEVKNGEDEAVRKVANIKGELKGAKERHAIAEKSAESIMEKFEQLLKGAGFSSLEEFTGSCIPEQEIDKLEKEVQEYTTNLQTAKERVLRAHAKAKGLITPDIDKLREMYNNVSVILEGKIREEQDLENDLKKITKLISGVEHIDKELEILDTRIRTLGYISDIANGKGNNRRGITFQRYVQATLLDDVLIAASRRLSIMSKGRFLLRRVTERADRRMSGGLNLEVDDAYTGKSRPVSTLSGGESFLAALSLALGLADVVQSYSGGMRLDTLFIDEGFGSLDSESLDLALRALMDLQKGGRLVAIISHVTELKERIDTRLEIIPGRNGSSARFVTI